MSNIEKTQNKFLQLTKDSNSEQIKAYFIEVFRLKNSGEEFPAKLDMVWPLVYANKNEAVRALKNNADFVEGFDYQFFSRNAENPQGGRPTDVCEISVPCLEFFIARKKRHVFEVYRQLAHAYVEGSVSYGEKNFITKAEYCDRFNKSIHSFNSLFGHYPMEFFYANGVWSISTDLCKKVELENTIVSTKRKLKERNDPSQLKINFKNGGGSHV